MKFKRTRFFCREHQERRVNWRGRGCPECEAAHNKRQHARQTKAHARDQRIAAAAATTDLDF